MRIKPSRRLHTIDYIVRAYRQWVCIYETELNRSAHCTLSTRATPQPAIDLNQVRVTQFTPPQTRNPFYAMAAQALRTRGWHFAFETDRDALLRHIRQSQFDIQIIHFHQLDPLYHDRNGDQAATASQANDLLLFLGELKQAGAHLVWTKHNPRPHDSRYRKIDTMLTVKALEIMDQIIVLGENARQTLEPFVAPERLQVVHHPGYAQCHGPAVPRHIARRELGLPQDRFVFGHLGEMRPYKQLPVLIEAFQEYLAQCPAPKPLLVLAGNPGSATHMARLTRHACDDIILAPHDIPGTDIPRWLGCMDAAVFAFDEIWCSSSVILARSYETPVVVPDIGCLREYVAEEDTGLFYASHKPGALVNAMRRMHHSPLLAHMRHMCRVQEKKCTAMDMANELEKIYVRIALKGS